MIPGCPLKITKSDEMCSVACFRDRWQSHFAHRSRQQEGRSHHAKWVTSSDHIITSSLLHAQKCIFGYFWNLKSGMILVNRFLFMFLNQISFGLMSNQNSKIFNTIICLILKQKLKIKKFSLVPKIKNSTHSY